MNDIPYLTTEQMREVDILMIENYHIELIQMMENAGRNLAHLARQRFLGGDPRSKKVLVLAGRGGNGGGGLVAARHLHNWGTKVCVITTHLDQDYRGVPANQLQTLRKMEVPIMMPGGKVDTEGLFPDSKPIDLIIDAIIGYSLCGAPSGVAAEMIRWSNNQSVPILSLDVPSGMDASSGQIFVPAVCATATLTLALPKVGFSKFGSSRFLGELYLADISIPPALYQEHGLDLDIGPIFALDEIIKL